jgi:hypothetical protein
MGRVSAGLTCRLAATAGCTAAFLLFPSGATALLAQTWVAYYGSDANSCAQSAPCADFATAIANTSAGGEIDVLTPGSYGPVTITEPVTIDGNGTGASIDFTGGEGVYVDLPAPGVVRLEGLDIDGGGVGDDAMFDSAGTVEIENSQLYGFADIGVGVGDTTQTASQNTVTVTHSMIDGGELGVRTFQSSPLGAPGQVTLSNDVIENATSAAIFTRTADQITVDDTLLNANQIGFEADTSAYHAVFSNDDFTNGAGPALELFTVPAGGQLEVDDSRIDYNAGAGMPNEGAAMPVSFTNDQIVGNGADGLELGGMTATLDGDAISGNAGAGVTGGTGSLSADVIDGNANGLVNTGGTMTISGSTIDGNTGYGVQASGASASDVLAGDTVSQNATGLQAENGGTIVALGANNSIYGNTIDGNPTSTVTTGAVGPVGPAGVPGPAGAIGSAGAVGPAGAIGPAGATGPAGAIGTSGAAGAPSAVKPATCRKVKVKVKGKVRKVRRCTSAVRSRTAPRALKRR